MVYVTPEAASAGLAAIRAAPRTAVTRRFISPRFSGAVALRSSDDGAVLDVSVGPQEDEARGVRAGCEDDGLAAAKRENDLRALDVLALVRAALHRRLDAAA